jgi:hypothetical protein
MEILKEIWANRLEVLSECFGDFSLVAEEKEFFAIVATVAVIILFGTGLTSKRFGRVAFVLGATAVGAAMYFGIDRGEAGEVLFNGTLL